VFGGNMDQGLGTSEQEVLAEVEADALAEEQAVAQLEAAADEDSAVSAAVAFAAATELLVDVDADGEVVDLVEVDGDADDGGSTHDLALMDSVYMIEMDHEQSQEDLKYANQRFHSININDQAFDENVRHLQSGNFTIDVDQLFYNNHDLHSSH
jgi:hypothetical protein